MTEECRIKYIQVLQCKYADFVDSLVEKLKFGRVCKDLEQSMLIVRDYIKSLYCYKALSELTNVYKIKIEGVTIDDDDEFINIVVTLVINGTPVVVYNLTSPVQTFPLGDILNAFNTLNSLPFGYQVLVDYSTNEVYLYSETTNTATITSSMSYITNQTSGTLNYNISNEPENRNFVLDRLNCLTTNEICNITHHAFELLEKCEC